MCGWRCWPALLALIALRSAAVATPLPPSLPWRELTLTAREHVVRSSITVRASTLSATEAAASFLPTASLRVVHPSGAVVILLESSAALAGRTLDERLWLDGASGAALQITDVETGAKNLRRVARLLDDGFLFEQRQPTSPAEAALPSERWSEVERIAASFLGVLPPGTLVTGALELLTSPRLGALREVGDAASFVVLVQRRLEAVTVTVARVTRTTVGFVESRQGQASQVTGEVPALLLDITSQPIDASGTPRFRFFGLEHEIHVLWEPQRRVPLEITGQIHLLGGFTITLERVVVP